MFSKRDSKLSGTGVVAACVATAGAVAAVVYFVRKNGSKRPRAVVDRCLRAVDELERRIVCSASRA